MFDSALRNDALPRARVAGWQFATICILAVGWSALRLYLASRSVPGIVQLDIRPQLLPSRAVAETDKGTRIQLYECTEFDELPSSQAPLPQLAARRIVAGPSDPRANCHGWVFTGGKYYVAGESIDTILRENGYERVTVPHVDDLVVWRDPKQLPVHTGIVKAVGLDDFVLVESKWGHTGRYLHEPGHPGYSQDFAFYRSPRSGHLLRITRPIY